MADESAEPLAQLPRPLAVAWGMDEAPVRGPKRELSHERIVEAAIGLADTHGLGAVTMAKVAEALGFTTMSLYRYVTNKDELLALMQDEAARLDGAVEDQDWEQGLRDFAELLFGGYRNHPWLCEVPVSRLSLLMPNTLGVSNTAMRAMRTLPLPAAEKQAILLLVVQVVRSYTQLERDLRVEDHPLANPRVTELLADVITPERFGDLAGLMDGRYPDDSGEEGDDAAWAIDLVISGIHQLVRESPAPHDGEPARPELTPAQQLAVAEAELDAVRALRKQAQQRVKELERRVRDATRDRDRAKERARH